MDEKIRYEDLSPELKEFFDDKFSAFDTELALLRKEVDELRTKRRKQSKKEFTDELKLREQKQDFLKTEPNQRDDPFDNQELVFWASYVLSSTDRREKLDTVAEVAKRCNALQKVVNHFKETALQSGIITDEEADEWARIRVKNYLEYVLLSYPTFTSKGQTVPMTFWPAISNWAINNFGSKVGTWQRERKIKDEPV